MVQISDFAVAANKDGLLEIVAVARPTAGDQQSSGAVWLNQQLTAPAGGADEWVDRWRSLGSPGGANDLQGIATARNPDGSLAAAVLNDLTIWYAGQTVPDGDWSAWDAVDNSGIVNPGPPALAQNTDGRLEMFTIALAGERLAVWHISQKQPGHSPWTQWHSLGFPATSGGGIGLPTVARNKDGRLEVFITFGDKVWHCWQTSANSEHWMPWASLDGLPGKDIGQPTVALDKQGRLWLFVTDSDGAVWSRRQHGPGQGPWGAWAMLRPATGVFEPSLAVAAGADARLVLFALVRSAGRQTLEKLEQTATDGEWAPGDPIQTDLLGTPTAPVVDLPALVIDGLGRLRLFLRIRGQLGVYSLTQTQPNSNLWVQAVNNFGAP